MAVGAAVGKAADVVRDRAARAREVRGKVDRAAVAGDRVKAHREAADAEVTHGRAPRRRSNWSGRSGLEAPIAVKQSAV